MKPMSDSQNTPFEQQLQRELSQSEQALAPETSRKLYQARRQAVMAARENPSASRRIYLPAIGSALTAAFLLVMLLPSSDPNQSEFGMERLVEDTELLSNQEDLEIVQDIEFYRWLAAVDHG